MINYYAQIPSFRHDWHIYFESYRVYTVAIPTQHVMTSQKEKLLTLCLLTKDSDSLDAYAIILA